jgi:hypothetical protein
VAADPTAGGSSPPAARIAAEKKTAAAPRARRGRTNERFDWFMSCPGRSKVNKKLGPAIAGPSNERFVSDP